MRPSRNIILTGAGFTKDFGGYLGGEMWSAIFSQREIAQNQDLRHKLLNEMNYEAAYHDVLNSREISLTEQIAFTTAIENAYREMHEMVCGLRSTRGEDIAKFIFREIFARFAGSKSEHGILFTLNQDLFIEAFYRNNDVVLGNHRLTLAGLNAPSWFFGGGPIPNVLGSQDWVQLPTEDEVTELQSRFWDSNPEDRFVYIKLHGSYGWRSASGSKAMVIGGEKEERIASEPLLRWYLRIFEKVLAGPACNLLVIGYGFKDSHINKLICNAIRNHQLRVFVISPVQPEKFCYDVLNAAFQLSPNRVIWEGLYGYYCGTVLNLVDMNKLRLTTDGKAFFRKMGILE
jgi:hypothetical protein